MIRYFLPLIFFISFAQHAYYEWSNDILNQRPFMHQNLALMQAAQWKAEYLGSGKLFSHCTEENECPNTTIERFGCKTDYPINGNSVESLIKGTADAKLAYSILVDKSPAHSFHLRAKSEFFQNQTDIGVGYFNYVYVFLSAKCLS